MLHGNLSGASSLSGGISGASSLAGGLTSDGNTYPKYSGEYEVTPTCEIQTIRTANTVLLRDITVNPIPSNYGLVTWNGSVLTVS